VKPKLDDKEFDKLKDSHYNLEGKREDTQNSLMIAYRNIMDILEDYCDLKEEYYSLIALWIIGTYFHQEFVSYPYLFFNAMRGSGKTRILRLISVLSKDGQMLNSLTQAVLFRTKGTLCIDEFEGIRRKGNENLRELLNSAYKKGIKVKRMRKAKTIEGEQQVVEEFEVYRPIVIANIWGMESVLGDRCINIVLEKSNNPKVTKMVEIFENDKITILTKELFVFDDKKENLCSLCMYDGVGNVYKEWNSYIKDGVSIYIDTLPTQDTQDTSKHIKQPKEEFFKKLIELDIDGRHLELAFPLFIIAKSISEEILDKTILTFQQIIAESKEEDVVENMDISLFDFISQEEEVSYFVSISDLTKRFREFLQSSDEWINPSWVGRALKRLGLIIQKKRVTRGVEVRLNYAKAKEKIRMFK